ncbi:hypothetical protein [Runella sp.]|uniref:hypothetical protein n=1 Tax=Runella sp. TaxID=1960881 RepID=UPI003018E73B
MIPVTYLPRSSLVLRQKNSIIACTLEARPGINLSASKTITVIQVNGDTNADDDTLSLNLYLLYQATKL